MTISIRSRLDDYNESCTVAEGEGANDVFVATAGSGVKVSDRGIIDFGELAWKIDGGDGIADLRIDVMGVTSLAAGDFVL